ESAAAQRLTALGFTDAAGALRHVAALSSGVSRRAAIQRSLLPVILAELADTACPDAGLLAYRKVSEQLGRSPWFLRLMRDGSALAPRLATALGSSRYVADLLERNAQGLRLLATDADLLPRSPQQLLELLHACAVRALPDSDTELPAASPVPGLERAVAALRRQRAHELLRIAGADVCGLIDGAGVGQALSDLTDAVIGVALNVSCKQIATHHGGALPITLAVIAMGRYGGRESGYASDADVMFVYQPTDTVDAVAGEAASIAQAVLTPLLRLLSGPGVGPPLVLDADLRPEGRTGPMALSLAGFTRYYQGRASTWEALALLRARPVAGDAQLGESFVRLIAPVRYPAAGLDAGQLLDLRRMKARVEAERLPRGADPTTHLKLGPGALSDVEWAVQLLALRYAHRHTELQTPRTLAALEAACKAGLIDHSDRDTLAASWALATAIRNALMLVRGTATDQLPRSGQELLGAARLVHRRLVCDAGEFVDHYLQTTRRARQVVEKLMTRD
ncbi:MAG: bifunctional [glutamine synthetase] adenylyltransferase/[glutamine synthetase]-adenylyl-L-tyrosine phosphorylase, partial [Mycobacteriales bacterium]